MLIHSKHNLCQLCCCPDTGCKDMKKNVFGKNPPPHYPSYLYFIKGNYSAPPQNIGYAVKLAIKSWQV